MDNLVLSEEIEKYLQEFTDEYETVNKIKTHLNEENDLLKNGHVTGSAWIVNEDRSKVLLLHHKKLRRWLQLGGHKELGENVYQTSLREALEESGLEKLKLLKDGIYDIDVHLIPRNTKEEAHYHFDIRFIFEASDEDPLIISDESNDLRWISINDISQYDVDSSILRMVEKLSHIH